MKSISVRVDDDTHQKLRKMAAHQGTSVSAIVREQVMTLMEGSHQESEEETENEKHRRGLAELLEEFQRKGIGISMADNQTREEMYQRNASR